MQNTKMDIQNIKASLSTPNPFSKRPNFPSDKGVKRNGWFDAKSAVSLKRRSQEIAQPDAMLYKKTRLRKMPAADE